MNASSTRMELKDLLVSDPELGSVVAAGSFSVFSSNPERLLILNQLTSLD